MLFFRLECIDKAIFDMLNLLCESRTVVGLRLIKLATGGVSAIPEALRLVPEKLAGLVDAQILVAARLIAGRPDLACISHTDVGDCLWRRKTMLFEEVSQCP